MTLQPKIAAVLLIAALLTAACGGGSSSPSPSGIGDTGGDDSDVLPAFAAGGVNDLGGDINKARAVSALNSDDVEAQVSGDPHLVPYNVANLMSIGTGNLDQIPIIGLTDATLYAPNIAEGETVNHALLVEGDGTRHLLVVADSNLFTLDNDAFGNVRQDKEPDEFGVVFALPREHVVLGAWAQKAGVFLGDGKSGSNPGYDSVDFSPFYFHASTVATTMPLDVTANYPLNGFGIYREGGSGGNSYLLFFEDGGHITADFEAGTLGGDEVFVHAVLPSILDEESSGFDLDMLDNLKDTPRQEELTRLAGERYYPFAVRLTLDATITGDGFDGTAKVNLEFANHQGIFDGLGAPDLANAKAGTFGGHFYGDQAAELAGIIQITGDGANGDTLSLGVIGEKFVE